MIGFRHWVGALALSGIGGLVALEAPVDRTLVAAPFTERSYTVAVDTPASIVGVWRQAPFRPDRTVPEPYRPIDAEIPTMETGPERPPWRLTGIVRGTDPVALIEGAPGAGEPPRMVAVGDPVGPWALLWLDGDSAVIGDGVNRWTYVLDVPWGGA